MSLFGRSVSERIVLLFAVTIAALLIIDVVAIIVLTIAKPGVDLSPFVTASSEIIAMMLGALIGYIGGRHIAPPTKE